MKKATNHHAFLRMVGRVEKMRDWFGNVFIVGLNISKMFAEAITQSAARFVNVYFFAQVIQYMILAEMHVKRSVMVRVRIAHEILPALEMNGQVLHRTRSHSNVLD